MLEWIHPSQKKSLNSNLKRISSNIIRNKEYTCLLKEIWRLKMLFHQFFVKNLCLTYKIIYIIISIMEHPLKNEENQRFSNFKN